jgi:hypothetical protein
MSFIAEDIVMAGLLRIDLPARVIRLSDFGDTRWGADLFESSDSIWGPVQAIGMGQEGIGDFATGGSISFSPPSVSSPGGLSHRTFQGSIMKFWIAEISRVTGLVVGNPVLQFQGWVDVTRLGLQSKARVLDVAFVDLLERLFLKREGNLANSRFHTSVWPGELGFENATGLQSNVAWGTESPPRGTLGVGSGGGGDDYRGGRRGFFNSFK